MGFMVSGVIKVIHQILPDLPRFGLDLSFASLITIRVSCFFDLICCIILKSDLDSYWIFTGFSLDPDFCPSGLSYKPIIQKY